MKNDAISQTYKYIIILAINMSQSLIKLFYFQASSFIDLINSEPGSFMNSGAAGRKAYKKITLILYLSICKDSEWNTDYSLTQFKKKATTY